MLLMSEESMELIIDPSMRRGSIPTLPFGPRWCYLADNMNIACCRHSPDFRKSRLFMPKCQLNFQLIAVARWHRFCLDSILFPPRFCSSGSFQIHF